MGERERERSEERESEGVSEGGKEGGRDHLRTKLSIAFAPEKYSGGLRLFFMLCFRQKSFEETRSSRLT